jgi:hypothetical protein
MKIASKWQAKKVRKPPYSLRNLSAPTPFEEELRISIIFNL